MEIRLPYSLHSYTQRMKKDFKWVVSLITLSMPFVSEELICFWYLCFVIACVYGTLLESLLLAPCLEKGGRMQPNTAHRSSESRMSPCECCCRMVIAEVNLAENLFLSEHVQADYYCTELFHRG